MGHKTMEEIWKEVSFGNGRYFVSDIGRVKSIRGGKERIMTLRDNGHGYLNVHFRYRINNEYFSKYFYVHRLVAQEFIPNKNEELQINHKDNNRGNNILSNLEWCTIQENCDYKVKQKRHSYGEKASSTVLKEKDILFIRNSIKQNSLLAKEYNVSTWHIRRIKRRVTWSWLP